MRLLEFGIPLLLTIYLLAPPPRPAFVRAIPIGALLLMLTHFVVDGYRWQMVLIYLLTLVLVAIGLNRSWDIRPLASYLTIVLLAVSTALPILLPVPSIPIPSGPYQVGTRIYELVDSSRREIYSGKEEARRFMIQVWYPSEISSSDVRAPWMADSPTPPAPNTATVEPGSTLAVLSTAPTPVVTPQPM